MTDRGQPKTRREFIRSAGRTAAVAAVAGGGALLAMRSASSGCDAPTRCEKCRLLGECDLPEARAAMKRQENE